jgi:hypothetical protein
MRFQNAQLPPVSIMAEPIVLGGGLDETTPPMRLKPGFARAAQNFECSLFGGYRRIAGYERFDGQASPSDANYAVLPCSSITGGAVGNTLTGATSGATGVIIAITATQFILTKTALVFQAENVNVGGPTIGVATGAAVVNGGSTALLHAQYKNLAADQYRNDIAAVPGQGNVLGVNLFNDVVYAFRNAVGGATAAMYKSTVAGWSLVALGREIAFTSGGTYEILEGDTITGATSTAFAVVTRVVLQSGTWAAGTAAGYLVFASDTGAFQAENLDVGANLNVATIAGDASAITLLPDGRYEFVNANFTGSTDTKRMYGADGVNPAFEFDGTVFVKIRTGMTQDAPSHIASHLYHLFLSFRASVQHSSPGFPYQWTPVTGAAELATGDNITGFSPQVSGENSAAALAIFTNGRLFILYGTGTSDWQLVSYKDEIGARAYTMQSLVQTMFMDTQGVTDLATAAQFGNFSHAVLTNAIKRTLTGYRNAVIASSVSRDLSQYRLFFTNDYGFYITMVGRKVVGIMPVLYADTVRCTGGGLMNDNTEAMFFGSDDGMVHQMDKGTSFDGDAIESYIHLAYNFSQGLRTLKKYRDGVLEVSGNGYAAFSFGYSLGYGATTILQPADQSIVTSFVPVFWDTGNWEQGVWDGQTLLPSTFELDGEAENISIAITSNSDYYEPFTLSGGLIHYSPRRELR